MLTKLYHAFRRFICNERGIHQWESINFGYRYRCRFCRKEVLVGLDGKHPWRK